LAGVVPSILKNVSHLYEVRAEIDNKEERKKTFQNQLDTVEADSGYGFCKLYLKAPKSLKKEWGTQCI
jgi:hypothetical protein